MSGSTHAAFRLSALAIAAGTILSLASGAAAQSRLERAERALQRAQQELEQARRDAGRTEQGGEQKIEMQCELACPDCPDCPEGARASGGQRELELTATDDDDDEASEQPKHRVERRIILRGDGDHVCPMCGRPMDGESGPQRMKMQGGLGGLFERAQPGTARIQVRRLDGGEGGPVRIETRGKVIVLDDNGERREFNFGGPEGGREEGQGGQRKRIEIRRQGGDGDGEQSGPHNKMFRLEVPESGPHGAPHAGRHSGGATGRIIIIGPDGNRQEFDLGGMGGGMGGDEGGQPARRRAPRVQIQEFRDGDATPAHLDDGDGQHKIRIRTVTRSSAI